jgi:hypothetical protein
MSSATAMKWKAVGVDLEHFGEVAIASAVESVQHLTHEGVSLVVVGARYNAVVDVRCYKDSVAILVLSAQNGTLVSCPLETLAL